MSAVQAWQSRLEFQECGRLWRMQRPADLEKLWEAMDGFDPDDERLPYWTDLWPSSLGLAQWLLENKKQIRGKICLDIGCGIGFSAMVGAWLGASVLAMDYEKSALHFARNNAIINGITQPMWAAIDWRKPAVRKHSLSLAWGGDIMYERGFAAPLADFLNHILTQDGVAWIAEPARQVYDFIHNALTIRGLHMRNIHELTVLPLTPPQNLTTIKIWQISRF
jgi:predicted nicotinamide N-methyase